VKSEAPSSVVSLRNVSKVYFIERQKVEALRSINLEVPRATMVALTGKSGAGKSTLLHIVGILDRPTSGQVFLNGTDVSKMRTISLQRFATAPWVLFFK